MGFAERMVRQRFGGAVARRDLDPSAYHAWLVYRDAASAVPLGGGGTEEEAWSSAHVHMLRTDIQEEPGTSFRREEDARIARETQIQDLRERIARAIEAEALRQAAAPHANADDAVDAANLIAGLELAARIARETPEPVPTYTCPRCKVTTANRSDVEDHYCRSCERFDGTDEA